MISTLRLFIKGIECQVMENLPISIDYSVQDVREPDKKKTDYSKTIRIPGNSITNPIFENAFDLNITHVTFNPNKKLPAQLCSDRAVIINGNLQLVSITHDVLNHGVIYECNIFGRGANLFFDIGEKLIIGNANPANDISFSEYAHIFNDTNIQNSWATSNIVSGTATPLVAGKGYRYALIDYGFNNGSDTDFYLKHLRPVLFLREYLYKIFEMAGWVWQSAFLDSAFFKSIAVPTALVEITKSKAYLQANTFFIGNTNVQNIASSNWTVSIGTVFLGGPTTYYSYIPTTTYTTWTSPFYETFDNQTVPYYNGGLYSTSLNYFKINQTTQYNVIVNVNFQLTFNPPTGAAYGIVSGLSSSGIIISSYNGSSVSIINSVSTPYAYWLPSSQIINVVGGVATIQGIATYSNTLTLPYSSTTQYRALMWHNPIISWWTSGNVLITSGASTVSLTINNSNTNISLSFANPQVDYNDTLDPTQCLPINFKQKDFVSNVFKMFNLWVEPSKTQNNTVIIEPYPTFITNNAIDWTNKRDITTPESYAPMGFLDAQIYRITYKEDNDYYNQLYKLKWLDLYGRMIKYIDNDFLRNENKNEVVFAPTPSVGNVSNGLVIPKIFNFQNGTVSPLKPQLRILIYGGMKNLPYGSFKWHLQSSVSASTSYPYIGHLDDPYTPSFDLNFDFPYELFWNLPNTNYTNNNIGNAYWKPFLNQITDPNSVLVTRNYFLKQEDIFNFSFRNIIYDDGQYYRVNAIKAYDPLNPKSTKVELLKLVNYVSFVPNFYDLNNSSNSTLNITARTRNVSDTPKDANVYASTPGSDITTSSYRKSSKPLFTTVKANSANDGINDIYFFDTTSGALIFTLTDYGSEITLVSLTSNTNTVTLIASNGATINGGTSAILLAKTTITLITINGNWVLTSGRTG